MNRIHRAAAIISLEQRLPHFWLEPRKWLTTDQAPQKPPAEWEEVETGLEDFDKRFRVRSSAPEEARKVLAPPLTDALLALPYGRWEVSYDGEALMVLALKPWELGDYERGPEVFSSVIAALPKPGAERGEADLRADQSR